jgi:MraZ protein
MAQTGEEGRDGALDALDLVDSASNSLDAKRRIAIPKKHREQIAAAKLTGSYVLSFQLGGEPCLALYPPGQFSRQLRKLETMLRGAAGVGNKTVRAYMRRVRMSATRLTPDKQSRITLTEAQCAHAEITKQVVFVGSGDHLELWSPEQLDATNKAVNFSDLASQLFGDF